MTISRTSTLLLPIVALLAACGTTQTVKHRLHLPPVEASATSYGAPTVRVELPSYVERDYLMRREQGDQMVQFDYHRWEELPSRGLARLIRERLAATPSLGSDSTVRVKLARFEVEANDIFRALGSWEVTGSKAPVTGRVHFTRRLSNPAPDHMVEAMSASAEFLAERIRSAIIDATSDELRQ